MLDTNVCSRIIRKRPDAARARLNAEAGNAAIYTITLMELLRGAAKSARPSANRAEVESLAAHLEVLDFDPRAALHAGDIHTDLQRRGVLIGPYDVLIAGHARSRGLMVITGNPGEFRRVDGLRCEDWLSDRTKHLPMFRRWSGRRSDANAKINALGFWLGSCGPDGCRL